MHESFSFDAEKQIIPMPFNSGIFQYNEITLIALAKWERGVITINTQIYLEPVQAELTK